MKSFNPGFILSPTLAFFKTRKTSLNYHQVQAGAKRLSLKQLAQRYGKKCRARVTAVKVYDDPAKTVELSYAKKEAKQQPTEKAGAPKAEKEQERIQGEGIPERSALMR